MLFNRIESVEHLKVVVTSAFEQLVIRTLCLFLQQKHLLFVPSPSGRFYILKKFKYMDFPYSYVDFPIEVWQIFSELPKCGIGTIYRPPSYRVLNWFKAHRRVCAVYTKSLSPLLYTARILRTKKSRIRRRFRPQNSKLLSHFVEILAARERFTSPSIVQILVDFFWCIYWSLFLPLGTFLYLFKYKVRANLWQNWEESVVSCLWIFLFLNLNSLFKVSLAFSASLGVYTQPIYLSSW